MNYQQSIEYLFAQLPMYQRDGKVAYKANLDNTIAFDKYFNEPHKSFKTIHVAGTNGKGSVSHMLASILQEAGLKTGLYTSPHLIDFRERIKVNGELIPEDEVVNFVNSNKGIIDTLKPSFFEMTVAMAFNYFRDEKVDVAVIEVGMGGRLDSTNIIHPLVSIITNIGFDHMTFLGNTLSEIATEKAGIIKKDVPVVIGEINDETLPVFEKVAIENDSRICFAQRRFIVRPIKSDSMVQEFAVKNIQSGTTFIISLDLLGEYQLKNVISVFGALQILVPFFNVPKQAITKGMSKVIENTGLMGRWQQIQVKPKVICDTGHNKEGLIEILQQLKKEVFKNIHFVLGVVNDKEIDEMLQLLPKNAFYYFTQAEIPRALNCQILANKGLAFGLNGESFPNVKKAYLEALKIANFDDLVFVGGSTFVVADLLKYLRK